MLATPAGLTVVTFLSLRMRPEALRPVKWRLAEWPRRILPPAVTLKRLRTPRCVFNFILGFDAFLGISKTFLLPLQLSRRAEQRFLTSLCLPQTGSNDRRDHAPERVPRYSAARLWATRDASGAAPRKAFPERRAGRTSKWRREKHGLLRLLGSGTRLPRSSGSRRAFLGRHGLDLILVANFDQQPIHFGTPHFLVCHLPTAVKNHGAHFVAVAEEADNLILANLIIVFSGVGPKLDFF